jgi:hypothetical protein
MIVRTEEDQLLLITQPEHAGLSADLLSGWRADGLDTHPHRDAILLATREHDNGWLEVDAAPAIDPDSGVPRHFMYMPEPVKQAIWPRALARLAPRSSYAAALVAQHAVTIHAQHRAEPNWRSFFRDIEEDRERLLETAVATGAPARERFKDDYSFLLLGDVMSLAFCNGWTDASTVRGYSIRMSGGVLRVHPDPFGGCRVAFAVRARRIPRRRYISDDDLRRSLWDAPEVIMRGAAASA